MSQNPISVPPGARLTYEDTLDALREFIKSLGDFVEGSPAQKSHLAFWLPLFQREFAAHGVPFRDQ